VALHQLPVLVRVGSKVDLGDLRQEWKDAVAAAARDWFEKNEPSPSK